MNVWQIAVGESGRDYREIFFDYDIMIIGPSRFGDALSNSYTGRFSKIHSFAHNPEPGDRVIMRLGKEILGVGQIPSGNENQYSFDMTFNCVYGWDLCHYRRVIWAEDYSLGKLATAYKNIGLMTAFTQVHIQNIVEMVRKIDESVFQRKLKKKPDVDTSVYSEEKLGVELFRAGISNKNIEDIVIALKQAGRLFSLYDFGLCGRKPTEYEIVSHMILPLFLGLGWSHQQIAVEWNRADMAFFKKMPTTPDNCVMILEAKGLGNPLGGVLKQPVGYVRELGLKDIKYILVTDGANLFVYSKPKDGQWSENLNPVSYLCIHSLQKEYILPKKTSSIDTLVRLQPSAV